MANFNFKIMIHSIMDPGFIPEKFNEWRTFSVAWNNTSPHCNSL